MKTKYIIIFLFFLFFGLCTQAQTYTIDQTQTISVTTAYVNNAYMTWNIVSTVTDKPLKITYSISTELGYDFMTVYSVDNSGALTPLLRTSGLQNGTITTIIPNGKALITFKSDVSICYANNPSVYTGLNITFSTDNNSIQNENTYTSGNSIVNGKLGIGGAPNQLLTVKGGKVAIQDVGATVSDEGYTGSLMITKPAASGQYINLVRQGMMPWSIGKVYNANTFAIGQGTPSDGSFTNPIFNITNGGFVGIGTITPNAKIESVTGVNVYPATSGATQSGAALRLRGGDNAVLDLGVNNVNTWIQATDQTKLDQNYNICLNPNGGNVAIGTKTASDKLSVAGGISKLTLTGIDGVYDNFLKYGFKPDLESGTTYTNRWHGIDATISAGSAAANKMKFRIYGGGTTNIAPLDIMTLTGEGNVGIGCDPGTSALKVYKAELPAFELASATARFTIGVATCIGCWANDAIPGDVVIRGALGGTHNILMLMPNNSHDGSTYIGFGDGANNSWVKIFNNRIMRVNGTIMATEVKVTADVWADYVFKPTYKLMPLNQVEQYVNTNSHLPEMPSAAEVSKNGLNMGEMQNKLLQKVEELTLYMIDQQKTINQQSAKIEELEKKLK